MPTEMCSETFLSSFQQFKKMLFEIWQKITFKFHTDHSASWTKSEPSLFVDADRIVQTSPEPSEHSILTFAVTILFFVAMHWQSKVRSCHLWIKISQKWPNF